TIRARAANRGGSSDFSNAVTVRLDTTIPQAPAQLTAKAKDKGRIELSWNRVQADDIEGYYIYRQTVPFDSPSAAGLLTAELLKSNEYMDLPESDGTYYYRVTAVSTAGNESPLSNQASAVADSEPPEAVSISYSPQGASDPETGAMAAGRVDLELEVNEPLLTRPFVSIVPDGGIPLSVELEAVSDTLYTGFFTIDETTVSGPAGVNFSARDQVGNIGYNIIQGGTVLIDTHGPEVVRLKVFPASPIQNDPPATITAVLGLDEALPSGETPVVRWQLSGGQYQDMAVDSLDEIPVQAEDAQTWQAEFTLPADGGLDAPEILSLSYQGTDALGNTGSAIAAPNDFQVYQGDLPPLAIPAGLAARVLPAGEIELTWYSVDGAAGYQVYRQAPAESGLTPYGEPLLDGTVTELRDFPGSDQAYTYAVTSLRQDNDQTAESGLSEPVTVTPDSQAPPSPQNFQLNQASNGIHATWDSPGYTETVTFLLYRDAGQSIDTLEGLTPLIQEIPSSATGVVDPNPAAGEPCYAAAARDAAGNISAPSNSDYLNINLLPVSSLTVELAEQQPPVVRWTHSGSIAGCDIYLGQGDNRLPLNETLVTETAYTDTGYAGDERTYTVVAVDANDQESLARSITLPPVDLSPAPDARIKRGIMNSLAYTVTSRATANIPEARLQVDVNGRSHVSESFSLAPGQTRSVSVVVGGYADLPAVADTVATLVITEDLNETVHITRTDAVEVSDGLLELRLNAEEFTRGGTGAVRFTLENTCAEEIEIITAANSGRRPSPDIDFSVEDRDGNTVTAAFFTCDSGAEVTQLANGNTVARLAPGESFTSAPVEISVPSNVPDDLTAVMRLDHIYYHHGRTDEVVMSGMSTTTEVSLVDTAWYGEILSVSPETSTGDDDITITGRAVERATGQPLAGAVLNLFISNNGFERRQDMVTADNGEFSYVFQPLSGEAGHYQVCAIHPERTERPVQATFDITKVSLQYAGYDLSIPRNYEQTVALKATAGDGTEVENLRFECLDEDQPGGSLPAGVHIDCGTPVSVLYGQQTTRVDFTVWADNTADDTGQFVLRLVSDGHPGGWALLPVTFTFRAATPTLGFTPDHIDTGVSMGNAVTETLTLENRGTADLENVRLELVNPDGSAAPSWVALTTDAAVGVIAPGQTCRVGIMFAPPEDAIADNYEFRLQIQSDNYETTHVNLYAAVTASGQGDVLFHVSDLYTGTVDDDNNMIAGLANARIHLQNEQVLTETYDAVSGPDGQALLLDLPAGSYQYRVRADNHQEETGRVWIKPGVAVAEEVFLEYTLVTVEWEVTEITIEDKYEIVLSATYETQVPAPVVVMEPASVSLPEMSSGDVFQGEFTITNQGLVRADDVSLSMPADDRYFQYEFLTDLPESLQAGQR
ncbi:MAG: NEW3 domain-containing protein, partial [Desulfosudaceae bacterium]